MALLWIDGFDKYGDDPDASNPSTIIEWKYTADNDNLIFIRTGSTGNGILIYNSATYLHTPILTGNRTLIAGFAFKMRDVDDGAHIVDFRSPDSAGATVGYYQLNTRIRSVNSANEIAVYNGAALLDTTSGVDIQPDTWYYFEQKVYCDDSAGTVTIQLDDSEVMSFTGGDTNHSSTYNCYSAVLFRLITADYLYLDDLYICDGSGSKNNDFLGTCNVQTLSPTSDVASDWGPNTGSDNYAVIDEAEQNANYISDDTTGRQATFELDSLTINGTPVGVMICAESQLSDKINKCAKFITSNGAGTLEDAGYVIPGTDNPLTSSVIMEDDSDGNSWASSTVNSLRIGVEVV